jgi:putative ABC transport system permease protein
MMAVALRGLLGRKLRALLTGFAIVLGVAMVSGSFILTDTISRSFDKIFGESYASSDVVVSSKPAVGGGENDSASSPGFSENVLAEISDLPDVEAAVPSIEDSATLIGTKGKPLASPDNSIAIGVAPDSDQRFNPLVLLDGAWPDGPTQIAVDTATAKDEGFEVGDTVGAIAEGPVRRYEITGIVRFGSTESLGGATIAVFDVPTAQRLFDKEGRLDIIRVAGKDDATPAELVKEIRPLLPVTAEVKSATAQAKDDSSDVKSGVNIIRDFLLAFGGIALFVGSFVIANTFSITVAQRMRELATLRTIGASRKQVLWSVILEAVVIGLIASVGGLFFGLALAVGLKALLNAIGVGLPDAGLVFSTRTVIVSLLVGVVVATLASVRPALRATRVPPIAAVREGAVLPPGRFARFGLPVAIVIVAIAVALFAYGVFASGLSLVTRLLSLGVGVILLFIGVALVAPRIVRPLAAVLGWPSSRVAGAAGSLARDNATRNPSRTASTAAALMIGLALVTFVSVLAQGVRTSFVDAVDELFVADYGLIAESDFGGVSTAAADALARAPGVEVVSDVRSGEAKAFGDNVDVSAVDPSLPKVVDMSWKEGSDAVPTQLGSNGAFVTDDYADDHDLGIGSRLRLRTPTGDDLPLVVKGVFAEPKGGSPFGRVTISTAAFDRSFTHHTNEFVFANVQGGATPENTARLERAMRAYPDAKVQTRDEFKDSQIAGLNKFVNLLYALLGLSVIVSLFGIVNTLVLSVFERTRELGMLRAIGMTRRQVRRMITHESIVTALIGATLGIVVGMFLAALVTRALSDEGIVFAVPWTSLALFVIVAIIAGMLAAILPARRASRLNVLEALQYE